MTLQFLHKESTALIVVDVQEKLFAKIANNNEVLAKILSLIEAFHILEMPLFISEQYPQGLGKTVPAIQKLIEKMSIKAHHFEKRAFSCMQEPSFRDAILNSHIQEFLVVGIEAHVCVLQTAKELLKWGKKVTVATDATSSRNVPDFTSAKGELLVANARLTTVETILFELVRDSRAPAFKAISKLITS